MALLDVAQIQEQGNTLLIVFVPPETAYFNDEQRIRLRDLLIKALVVHGLTGELIAVWELEGHLRFIGNPHWREFLTRTGYNGLHHHATWQISCD